MNKFEEIIKRDDVWFKAAFASALLVFATAIIGTVIAFLYGASDAASVGARVDIVYKLGLIGAGFITFCTVGWRGLLATQQVDAQRKQIEKLTEQISVTAENNLASLLQKGAELISNDKPGYVSAGIATLQAVATDKNPKFATEAMDVMADYLQTAYPDAKGHPHAGSVRAALAAGERVSRRSGRFLQFKTEKNNHWPAIFGVRKVSYEGGELFGSSVAKMLAAGIDVTCKRTTIFMGEVDIKSFAFRGCTFNRVKIIGLDKYYHEDNIFIGCDFSDAKIADPSSLNFGKEAENWFAIDHPPRCDQPLDLTKFITREEMDDDIPF